MHSQPPTYQYSYIYVYASVDGILLRLIMLRYITLTSLISSRPSSFVELSSFFFLFFFFFLILLPFSSFVDFGRFFMELFSSSLLFFSYKSTMASTLFDTFLSGIERSVVKYGPTYPTLGDLNEISE